MANHLSADVAGKLLDKLSTDDDFRDLFKADPRAALKQVGHVTPDNEVGKRGADPVMCCNVAALADKEAIRVGHAKLMAALTSTMSQEVFKATSS